MRPNLSEQLGGLRRSLEVVVAPSLTEEYPREILESVIRVLAMLEVKAGDALPFLIWDSEQTAGLLADVARYVPTVGAIQPSEPVDVLDVVAADRENDRLRTQLAEAIPTLSATPGAAEVYAAVIAHLRERMARYPYVPTGSLPSR